MQTFNFEKIKQKNPTEYVWFMASNMLNELLSVVCSNATDILFINYFARKTFGFLKLKEKLSTKDLQEHLLVNLCNTYKTKSRLLKRNILIKLPGNYYCLNILGIVSLYKDIFSPYYNAIKKQDLGDICSLAKNKMDTEEISLVYLMQADKENSLKLQETLKTNAVKRVEKKAKRRQIFMQKEITTVHQVISYADARCEELGIDYRKNVPLSDKERGQAKNWLKGCCKNGLAPKEILNEVCENWLSLHRRIKDKSGDRLLPRMFSFPKFYIYKRPIEEELAVLKRRKKIKVVQYQL